MPEDETAVTSDSKALRGRLTGEVSDARSWVQRYRNDRQFRQSVRWGLVGDAVLCASIVYLVVELPHHNTFLKHVALWVSAVLCPFMIFVFVVRSPWGSSRVQQGYKILPFETLKTKPDLEGSALAAFLEREIAFWRIRPNGERMLKTPVESGAGATLSVAGATVSLTWLWNRLLYAVTDKRDIIIAGLLLDTETPLRLRIWRSNYNGSTPYWEEMVGDGPLIDALGEAMAKLAFDVLEELEPLTAGEIDSYRWRDEDAIRLMGSGERARQRTAEQDLKLAVAFISAGYLTDADRTLYELEFREFRGGLHWQARVMEAQLRAVQGKYPEAQRLFTEIGGDPVCGFRWKCFARRLRGDALAADGKYEAAIEQYGQTLDLVKTVAQVSSARLQTGGKSSEWDQLAKALASRPAGVPKDDVDSLLYDTAQALSNRARCRVVLKMQARQPLYDLDTWKDLIAAREVLQVKDDLAGLQENEQTALTIILLADIGFAQQNYDYVQRCAGEAAAICARILSRAETELRNDPRNMQAQANIAWSCFRQAVSYDYIFSARALQAAARSPAVPPAGAAPQGAAPQVDAKSGGDTNRTDEVRDGQAVQPAPEAQTGEAAGPGGNQAAGAESTYTPAGAGYQEKQASPIETTDATAGKAGLSSGGGDAEASPLEKMQATDPETHDIVMLLLQVSVSERQAVGGQVGRANVQWEAQRRAKYVWSATLMLCEAVLRQQGPGDRTVLEFTMTHPAASGGLDPARLPPIDALAQKYEAQTDLNQSEVRNFCMSVHDLLERTSVRANIAKLNEVMETEGARTASIQFGSRCRNEFARLGRSVRRSAAEAAYGFACLSARDWKAADAALYLRDAAIREGEGTFAYRNRAALDEYFLRVWNMPEFQAMLQWTNAPSDLPVDRVTNAAAAAASAATAASVVTAGAPASSPSAAGGEATA